ncbi:MAG: hypothetical protein IKN59_00340 [Paludibacteraceae bacterium]|nr:hypothetical protein [Paludibacteraceae bacterium]
MATYNHSRITIDPDAIRRFKKADKEINKKESLAYKDALAYVEINVSLDEWLRTNYLKKQLKVRNDTILMNSVHIVNIDEDDVQFGYIEVSNRIIPFIAQYLLTSDTKNIYRVNFLDEYLPSMFNAETFDYEEAINELAQKGKWESTQPKGHYIIPE